jgi:hypothetical protein
MGHVAPFFLRHAGDQFQFASQQRDRLNGENSCRPDRRTGEGDIGSGL